MKFSLRSVLAGAWVLGGLMSGCGKEPSPTSAGTNAAASGNPITAPVDYLGAVSKAKRASEKVIDTATLNQAVQLFQAGEGRMPRSLDEVVTEGYLPRLPEVPAGMKIVFDTTRGEVRIVPR